MKYAIKRGAHISSKNAQKYGERLRQIARETGKVTPQDVVSDARSPQSPLHDHFEWDDTKAAEQYRLVQAGYLIRSLEVYIRIDDKTIRTRALESVVEFEAQEYKPIDVILKKPDLRQQLLAQAISDADEWRKRYEKLEELCEIVEAMEKAKKKFKVKVTGKHSQDALRT